MDTITIKQKEYIEFIEEFVSVKFEGTTKADASKYIDRYKDEAILYSQDSYHTQHGYF